MKANKARAIALVAEVFKIVVMEGRCSGSTSEGWEPKNCESWRVRPEPDEWAVRKASENATIVVGNKSCKGAMRIGTWAIKGINI